MKIDAIDATAHSHGIAHFHHRSQLIWFEENCSVFLLLFYFHFLDMLRAEEDCYVHSLRVAFCKENFFIGLRWLSCVCVWLLNVNENTVHQSSIHHHLNNWECRLMNISLRTISKSRQRFFFATIMSLTDIYNLLSWYCVKYRREKIGKRKNSVEKAMPIRRSHLKWADILMWLLFFESTKKEAGSFLPRSLITHQEKQPRGKIKISMCSKWGRETIKCYRPMDFRMVGNHELASHHSI